MIFFVKFPLMDDCWETVTGCEDAQQAAASLVSSYMGLCRRDDERIREAGIVKLLVRPEESDEATEVSVSVMTEVEAVR